MSDRVRLRALEQHDSEKCYKWFNDVEVTRYMLVKGPVSLPQEQQWIKSVSEDTVLNTSRPQFVFAIEAQTEGKQTHIGNIGLHGIDYCVLLLFQISCFHVKIEPTCFPWYVHWRERVLGKTLWPRSTATAHSFRF